MTKEEALAELEKIGRGELCGHCIDEFAQPNCANCGTKVVLTFRGQLPSGEHACSSDCPSQACAEDLEDWGACPNER